MGRSKKDLLCRRMFFTEGTVVRFKKRWDMRSWDGERWIMSILEGELATLVKLQGKMYLRLHKERFSLKIAKFDEVPLRYLEIVNQADEE